MGQNIISSNSQAEIFFGVNIPTHFGFNIVSSIPQLDADVLAYFGHDIVSSDPETIFSIYRDLTLTSLVTYSVA
jgi:hypothetical protein